MTLTELISRCEKATGPDREIDADIAHLLIAKGVRPAERSFWLNYAPACTASIDACVALISLVLPAECTWEVGTQHGSATGARASVYGDTGHIAYAAAPCLALLTCALKALEAKERTE